MEEKKLPWWRRALSVALDGLRSGFGLFSRPAKEDIEHAPGTAPLQQKATEEEIDLTEHSPALRQADEVVQEAAVPAEPETTIAAEPDAETQPAIEAEPEVEPQLSNDMPKAVPVAELVEAEDTPTVEPETAPAPEAADESVAVIREADVVESGSADGEELVSEEGSAAFVEEHFAELEDMTAAAAVEESPTATEEPSAIGTDVPGDATPVTVAEDATELVELDEEETIAAHVLTPEPEPEVTVELVARADDSVVAEESKESLAEVQEEPVVAEIPAAVTEERDDAVGELANAAEEAPFAAQAMTSVVAVEEAATQDESREEIDAVETHEEVAGETKSSVEQEVAMETAEPVAYAEHVIEDSAAKADAAVEVESLAEPIVELEAEPPTEVATLSEPAAEVSDIEAESGEEVEQGAVEVPELVPEPEPEPEPNVEAAMEPVIEEAAPEEATTEASAISELSTSPVELNVPETEEAPEMTNERAGASEMEEIHEEALEPETAEVAALDEVVSPALEYAIPELSEPMESNEQNQTAEVEPVQEIVPEPTPAPTAVPSAESEIAPEVEVPATEDLPVVNVENGDATPEAVTATESAETEAAPQESIQETADQPIAAATSAADAGEETSGSEEPAAPEPAAQPHKPFIKLQSRDNEADLSPFSVIVSQVYDGPLDLLLDLIRKQDIDIYDIPIARITAQFLAYVNQLKSSDVDVAGEFIYTASLLIHIKSKMLLPRAPSGPEDAAEDPRRELVERLLEHERFKNAAQMLQQKQMLEAATWTNPGVREFKDDESTEPEIAADTVDLVRVFRDILERARNRPIINVEEDSVTVGQMIQFLSRRLTMEDKPIALHRLLSNTQSERALIAMFLALLELVRLQAILLRQDRAFSEIFIKKNTAFESVMNEGLGNARDDWQ